MKILSPEKEIENLRWTDLTAGRAYAAEKIAIVGGTSSAHRIMVAKLADGTYASSYKVGKYAYPPSEHSFGGRLGPILRALVAIGAITRKALDRHREAGKQADERSRRRADSVLIAAALKRNNLKPTKQIERFIAAKGEKSK